jgi:hypothetical protein
MLEQGQVSFTAPQAPGLTVVASAGERQSA